MSSDVAVLERKCTKCRAIRPLDEFYVQPHGKYGRRAECIDCTALRTVEYREKNPEKCRKWVREAGRRKSGCPEPTRSMPDFCEICGRDENLNLDHDHNDGKFRGWICRKCNLGIGALGDTIPCLNRVLEYLLEAEENDMGD